MQRIVSVPPCRELKEYVRGFAQREIDCSTADVVQPVSAALEPVIQLDFCNSPLVEFNSGNSQATSPISIVGPHTFRRCCIRLKSPVESFGIFFQPLGLWQLFKIPLGLLVNQAYTGHDVVGKGIGQLWAQMAETATFDERVRLVQEYLLRAAKGVFVRTSVMNIALDLVQPEGERRIAVLASHANLGVRQFERRFSEEMGMAPKLFARIARYQRALDAKVTSPPRSWLNIAHAFGYHDQMHMIRDFQDLSGSSPSRTLMQLGDMRPEALAAPREGIRAEATALSGFPSAVVA